MINREEIDNLANLARLDLDEAQKMLLAKDLDNILGYVEQLKGAPTPDVKDAPTSGVLTENIMRQDEVTNDQSQKLVEMAPKNDSKFVRVKKIL